MFEFLRKKSPVYSLPPGRRIYAIGDVHGRADLLAELQQRIVDDAASGPGETVIVMLGDYVDRGPDSRGVIEMLAAPPPAGMERICLLGNHEEQMLAFLSQPRQAAGWLKYGGRQTLESYGIDPEEGDVGALSEALAAALPPRHLEFLRTLALYYRDGGYFFAHAGIRPGVPLQAQSPEDLVWIREPFLSHGGDHGAMIVHGHTRRQEVDWRGNRINVDTSAFATGVLTALVLEGDGRRLLQTG